MAAAGSSGAGVGDSLWDGPTGTIVVCDNGAERGETPLWDRDKDTLTRGQVM